MSDLGSEPTGQSDLGSEPTGQSDRRVVSSSVEVAADPATAFSVFTDELDLWWVRGPINHFDGGRTAEMRCEPGVGGRLLEVYDAGDALELARIGIWEPGRRLAWTSSIDDVEVEVRFVPSAAGTTVTVTAGRPAGGKDAGGTAWVRVVPQWLPAWCDRRETAPHQVRDLARLALAVSYARPAAASRWLADTFGFESDQLPQGDDPLPHGEHGHPWIEFRIDNCSLTIVPGDGGAASSHVPWVYVDDVEAHYRRSVERGARVVTPLASPWGLPWYTAADPEGYHWTFAQARPTQ